MPNFETETFKLIDAIPTATYSECPLAFDASGWRTSHFEVVAMNESVAEALRDGKRHVASNVETELVCQARFNDPIRMGKYAACLLRRASGGCAFYDAGTRQDRNIKEALDILVAEARSDV